MREIGNCGIATETFFRKKIIPCFNKRVSSELPLQIEYLQKRPIFNDLIISCLAEK